MTEVCIIIAEDLTPSDTAQLNLDVVRGFITEIGSRTSHSAIMARTLEIPAIVGVGSALRSLPADAFILMDAEAGSIIINPSADELAVFQQQKQQYDQHKAELTKLRDQPSVSRDGQAGRAGCQHRQA